MKVMVVVRTAGGWITFPAKVNVDDCDVANSAVSETIEGLGRMIVDRYPPEEEKT